MSSLLRLIVNSVFRYVPVHLQYILTELLKNAFRATVEKQWTTFGMSSNRPLPPVLVTISCPSRVSEPVRKSCLSMRIRDEGGGVSPANMPRIFSYAFTTASRDLHLDDETGGGPYAAQHVGGSAAIGASAGDGVGGADLFGEITGKGVQTGVGTIAGLGYGLPMSRLYAKYVLPRWYTVLDTYNYLKTRYFGGALDLFSLDGWG